MRRGRVLGALLFVAFAATVFASSAIAVDPPPPPVVTVTGIPGGHTNNPLPSIAFTTTAGTTECSLNGLPYVSCATSPFTPLSNLADGSYTLMVKADNAGSLGFGSTSFTVDTLSPDLTITAPTPGQAVDSATPDVSLAISGGTAECSFDGAAFVACNAQFVASPLPDGAHRLCVRATDLAGNAKQVCVDFSTDDSLNAPGTEGPPPIAHSLTSSRVGAVKSGRFSVPLNLSVTPRAGTAMATACAASVALSVRPRARGAKTVTKRVRMRASGSRCVAHARISLPARYKGGKATARARFGGSAALGSFSYAKTIKRL